MRDTFSIKVEGDEAILTLIPILDMAIAEELLRSLRECTSMIKNVALDSKGVERLSTPCVQIILSTAAEVKKNGGAFCVRNVSPGFERGMRDLGLTTQLDTWSKG